MKSRIVQILEATTGGTRRHLSDLVTHLDTASFDITVICSTLRDPAFLEDIETYRSLGIEVIEVPMVRHISPLRDAKALVLILRHLRRRKPALVHTHSAKAGFLGRAAARLAAVPSVVHTPHVFPFQMAGGRLKKCFYFLIEAWAARWTDSIVCVCPTEKRVARRWHLAPEHKLRVIENGIDVAALETLTDERRSIADQLGFAPGDPLVGMAGRFVLQKGQRDLVQAAAHVVGEFPDARFVLIGEGDLVSDVQGLIQRLDLGGNCFILPSRARLSSFYAALDVVVLPSLWEGLPYVLLEAMALEKAIVATTVGGIPDLISEGRTGLTVPPQDPEALARALCRLLSNPALRDELGARAGRFVEKKYRLKGMVEQTAALYRTLLDTGKSPETKSNGQPSRTYNVQE